MTGLRVVLDLGREDLARLRALLRDAERATAQLGDAALARAARGAALRARAGNAPRFVLDRLELIERACTLLLDEQWSMPASVRRRVRRALAYFAEPADLIPDGAPIFGYLDDAVMLEIVRRDLRHELDGHTAFTRARERIARRGGLSEAERARSLAAERRRLRARIQDRAARDVRRPGVLARISALV